MKSRISPKFLNRGTVLMPAPFTEIGKQGECHFLMENQEFYGEYETQLEESNIPT